MPDRGRVNALTGFGYAFTSNDVKARILGVVLNDLYINRDATMLDLITDAYGVSDDDVAGDSGLDAADLDEGELPSGDELASEIERFLRGQ